MLKSRDTKPYYPTADDRLWLLRAVAAEGKPEPMVARALVNLFMLQRSKGNTQTLAKLVRAYAQPVNPRWFPDGDLHIAAKAKGQDTAERAIKRIAHSMRTLAAMPPHVVQAVNEALKSSFESDITDYAAPTLDATSKGYLPRSVATPGVNRFWTRASTWPGYMTDATGALLPLIAIIGVLYWANKN